VSSSIPGVARPCGRSSALPCRARSSASSGDQPPVDASSSAKARAAADRNPANSASVIGRSVTVLTARWWHLPVPASPPSACGPRPSIMGSSHADTPRLGVSVGPNP
jgi:hypothetical protein